MRGILALALAACSSGSSTPLLPLTIGDATVYVEVAATPDQRARGLMFRRDLPPDGGMLFVNPREVQQSFWMRNTFVPLSIAFIDSNQRIVNVSDMAPFDELTLHSSLVPTRYALEVNQGWFAANRVGPGDRVDFILPADLPVE